MGISVLIAGKIRNRVLFYHAIQEYLKLRNQKIIDELVLSGWKDDYLEEQIDIGQLKDLDIQVVLANEPNIHHYSPGHLTHQLKCIRQALPVINPENFVFKTRVDVIFDYSQLPQLFDNVVYARPVYCPIPVFHKRIWVTHFEMFTPFWISDLVFMGTWLDIQALVVHDFSYEIDGYIPSKGAVPNPEIRHFMPNFEGRYSIVREYKEVWPYVSINNNSYKNIKKTLLNHPVYIEYMAFYYYVIDTHFLIGKDAYNGDVGLARMMPNGELGVRNIYKDSVADTDNMVKNLDIDSHELGLLNCIDSEIPRAIYLRKFKDEWSIKFSEHLASALSHKSSNTRNQELLALKKILHF